MEFWIGYDTVTGNTVKANLSMSCGNAAIVEKPKTFPQLLG